MKTVTKRIKSIHNSMLQCEDRDIVEIKTGSGRKVQTIGTILTPISVLTLDFSIVIVERL